MRSQRQELFSHAHRLVELLGARARLAYRVLKAPHLPKIANHCGELRGPAGFTQLGERQLDGDLAAVPAQRLDLHGPAYQRRHAGGEQPRQPARVGLAVALGHDHGQRLALQLRVRPAKHLFRGGVDLDDLAARVGDDDRVPCPPHERRVVDPRHTHHIDAIQTLIGIGLQKYKHDHSGHRHIKPDRKGDSCEAAVHPETTTERKK